MSREELEPLYRRVLSKTVPDGNGCLVWTGAPRADYGLVMLRGKRFGVHRVTYEYIVGPIPRGLVLDHLCRNTRCVNPEHLEPVTDRVNILRGTSFSAQNAVKTTCPNGHEYDTAIPGGRGCRTCRNEATRRWRERTRTKWTCDLCGKAVVDRRSHARWHSLREEKP